MKWTPPKRALALAFWPLWNWATALWLYAGQRQGAARIITLPFRAHLLKTLKIAFDLKYQGLTMGSPQ